MSYSPEAIRCKLLRRWWSVLYPLSYSPLMPGWLAFLALKVDSELDVVLGFTEIEVECDLQFLWLRSSRPTESYCTDEIAWMVRYDRHAGRRCRINLASMSKQVGDRAGHAGRAKFYVKSA